MARSPRYNAAKDPDWWYREAQRRPGAKPRYAFKVCTVCGAKYRPLGYANHKLLPAHRARLK